MQFFGKPDFFKYQKSFKQEDYYLHWYLDVSPKTNKVLSLHFESNLKGTQLELMDKLTLWVKDKDIGLLPKLDELGSNVLFPLALMTYRLFLKDIMGADIPYHRQKGEGADTLICRCFGVYKQEVVKFLIDESATDPDLATIGSHLRAGVGCGTCQHDLVALLETFGFEKARQEIEVAASNVPEVWEGLDSQQLASTCHDLLLAIQEREEAVDKLAVFGVKPGHVLIHYIGRLSLEEMESIVSGDFSKELGPSLTFSFR